MFICWVFPSAGPPNPQWGALYRPYEFNPTAFWVVLYGAAGILVVIALLALACGSTESLRMARSVDWRFLARELTTTPRQAWPDPTRSDLAESEGPADRLPEASDHLQARAELTPGQRRGRAARQISVAIAACIGWLALARFIDPAWQAFVLGGIVATVLMAAAFVAHLLYPRRKRLPEQQSRWARMTIPIAALIAIVVGLVLELLEPSWNLFVMGLVAGTVLTLAALIIELFFPRRRARATR
jgi:hypothetical protein